MSDINHENLCDLLYGLKAGKAPNPKEFPVGGPFRLIGKNGEFLTEVGFVSWPAARTYGIYLFVNFKIPNHIEDSAVGGAHG